MAWISRVSAATGQPIQPQSGLNPTQSDPIQPNPTYAKKNKSPRNQVTRLLKKYDQITLNQTKSYQIIPNMTDFFYFSRLHQVLAGQELSCALRGRVAF
jgi:hypothetical protein